MAKHGKPSLTVCSTAFITLGRAQARALGHADLPIAVIPHPFGIRSRAEVRQLAEQCVDDIARLVCESGGAEAGHANASVAPAEPAELIDAPEDLDEINALFRQRHWCDGLPVVPPTPERVERMLSHTRRARDEIAGTIAPGFGAATVEGIAINAVMAGCLPQHLPALIAAVEAVADPEFNLQAIQATTNPVAVWIIVNGPARKLGFNEGVNCMGQGARASATLGRALRLVLQNIGGALSGDMDRATQGQPGKYTFCCAENEEASPWSALHVERGFAAERSTVTVVGAEGTLNMNTHAKDAEDILRVFADTMAHGPSNDYIIGGEPWVMVAPEHAEILHRAGLSKGDFKRRLWEQSKMAASRLAAKDMLRVRNARRAELGEIGPDTLLPMSATPELIGVMVAGGPGTHSVYIPSFGNTRAITRAVEVSEPCAKS